MRLKFTLNLCESQRILCDLSDPSYKNRNKRGDAFTLFILGTEAVENNFGKWAFAKSGKLYTENSLMEVNFVTTNWMNFVLP